ncbi:MAG: DUF1311 domain-containing protein [Acidobacteria bacterium]|nr:DUF1311 domain-containing protein [Acidobacteriota bacterium]
MRGTPALGFLFLVSLPAFGATLSPGYQKCIDATDTNAGWTQCSDQEIKRQEARLRAVWNEAYTLIKKTSTQSAKMLLNEQRAWIKFKDSACNFYGSGDFGREGQVSVNSCKAEQIADRVETLFNLVKELRERFGG